jgi:hypothetical protein
MEHYIAVTMSDGMVYHYAFQTQGRAFGPGSEKAGWTPTKNGHFFRHPSDANIEYDLRKTEREQWNVERRHADGTVTPPVRIVHWRRLTEAEHLLFEAGRPAHADSFRNALVDRNGKIEYDIEKARECYREVLRYRRASAMLSLDNQWMRATGQGKKAEADAVEAQRQKWRDAPADPRIDSAQTVEELKLIGV